MADADLDRPARPADGAGRASPRTWLRALVGSPSYPSSEADRETVMIAGLEMPLRATVAISLVVLAILFDFSRTFIPEAVQDLGRAAPALRYQAIERAILFGLVPLAVVVLVFRDRPQRYGVTLGDWRWGLSLILVGCAVMTPLVIGLARLPQFREYYAISSTDPGNLALTNILDLVPTEFLLRGYVLFTLVRAIGPLGVLVATMPFVFSHLGKPEVELFSTLAGGLVYGWLNWRTGSIVWSAAAHVYIVTLLLVAAGST